MASIQVTDQNFKEQVLHNPLPVIVDFWAPWCVPCKVINPIMEALATEFQGKVAIAKINADENPQSVDMLQVMSMPTIICFKKGQPVKVLVGSHGKHSYQQMIQELLTS